MPEFRPEPRPYEMMVLIRPTVTDEALTEEVERISSVVTEAGGAVTNVKRESPWGRRRLAYQIQDARDATYVLYHFTTEPSLLEEIERDLKLDDRIIRYLLIRQDEREDSAEREETES
ncbi:MAG TPA: 30S ribosomal protein S6 [Nitrolancea sp.]|nr:30S ribosomal protein S6 [Nitrolancea sp.]